MNLLSEEKSLPQKISEDIITLILEENLQPGDKLPNETLINDLLEVRFLLAPPIAAMAATRADKKDIKKNHHTLR